MRTRKAKDWLLLAMLFSAAGSAPLYAAESARFQTLEQYTRLQIPASSGATFRLMNSGNGAATLIVDRVAPGTLDALPSWNDSRVAAVDVKPLGLDRAELTIRFKAADTDSFAYHQGGMVVLDLWKQEKPLASVAAAPAPVTEGAKESAHLAAVKVAKKTNASHSSRSPASVAPKKAVVSVKPLRRDGDLFQKFVLPMPDLTVTAKDGGIDLPPKPEIEELWKFTKGDKTTDEGRAYEFAKNLFAQKKYGLALKTIEIGRRDYPKSPHQDELRFLEALAYRRLAEVTQTPSLATKAEATFRELANQRTAEGKPLPFHRAIRLYFGETDYVAGRWLEAIQNLEYVGQVMKDDEPEFPYVQMMLAEAYVQVNQPRRAERVYRFLRERYPQHALAREALYRIADLLAVEKNYPRVVEEGLNAIKTYRDYEKARSEVLFSMGEASFWMGKYDDAEKFLRRYTTISSAQTNSALAWVRIGEIREVAHSDLKGARQAYLQAKNGYPFSQGDLVATVRLARIDLPNEKDPGFIVKSLQEMLSDKSIDIDLRRMAELTLGDYLLLTGEVEKALELARVGMAQTDGAAYEGYKQGYTKALFAKLQALNKAEKFSEALALYDKEKKWFDLHGAESFRAMADAYRGLGLYATANEFMERYTKELAKGRGLASARTQAQLELSRAKNSFARGAYAECLQLLPESDETEVLAMRAISEYRLGRKRQAYPYAAKALAAEDETLPELQVVDLMEITLDWNQNEREFPRMERDLANAAKLLPEGNERVLFARGDAAWLQKKHGAAEAAYRAALEKFPKGERADRARYNLGMSLLAVGKHEEAVKQLTELRDSGQGVWAESAKQELELIGWEKKYSSVLKRLPPSGLGLTN